MTTNECILYDQLVESGIATVDELNLKLKAVDELKEAIYYLERYYNYTGSTHGTEANDIMQDAVEYQKQRNDIVLENPKLFT
jgi:hypothetical protein